MSDNLLSFAQASKELAGRPHVSTLHRWRLSGIRGIRLETVLVGGRRYVSREALDRFVEATTAVADGEPIPTRTSKQREAAILRAEAELAAAGI